MNKAQIMTEAAKMGILADKEDAKALQSRMFTWWSKEPEIRRTPASGFKDPDLQRLYDILTAMS